MLDIQAKWPIVARNLFGLACLFGAATWMADVRIAAAVVASFIAGYMNEFHVVRSTIALLRGHEIRRVNAILAICGIVLSAVIVGWGFGLVLLLATGVYFVVDALVLRFR